MLKLYKSVNNQLQYWETWDSNDKTGIIPYGTIGEEGVQKEIKSGLFSSFRKYIQKEIDIKIS